jgi:hypothetical protein
VSDEDLRELERAAGQGDSAARVKFLRACERSGDDELRALGALEEIVYHAASYVLSNVETGSSDAVGIVKAIGAKVITPSSTTLLTEDDVVSMFAACARRVLAGVVAAWDARQAAEWPRVPDALIAPAKAVAVLAATNGRGEVALGIRATTWLNPPKDFTWMSLSLEVLSKIFDLHTLQTRDDLREWRRSRRRIQAGRATTQVNPFAYLSRSYAEVEGWVSRAPEFVQARLPDRDRRETNLSGGLLTLSDMRLMYQLHDHMIRRGSPDAEFFYTKLLSRDPSDVTSYEWGYPVVAAHASLVARWAALWGGVGGAR